MSSLEILYVLLFSIGLGEHTQLTPACCLLSTDGAIATSNLSLNAIRDCNISLPKLRVLYVYSTSNCYTSADSIWLRQMTDDCESPAAAGIALPRNTRDLSANQLRAVPQSAFRLPNLDELYALARVFSTTDNYSRNC